MSDAKSKISLSSLSPELVECLDIGLEPIWDRLSHEKQIHELEKARGALEYKQGPGKAWYEQASKLSDAHCTQAAKMNYYWRQLFGRNLSTNEIVECLVAEHGMTHSAAMDLPCSTIIEILKTACQTRGNGVQSTQSANELGMPAAGALGMPAAGATLKLELIPSGFSLDGKPYDLTGRPLAMLLALLKNPLHRCTASNLRTEIGVDDEVVTFPEQAVRDAAKKLRNTLREAMSAAGHPGLNPLRFKGKGKDLTYILNIP